MTLQRSHAIRTTLPGHLRVTDAAAKQPEEPEDPLK